MEREGTGVRRGRRGRRGEGMNGEGERQRGGEGWKGIHSRIERKEI